jgi:N-acetylmuramoyl-L-alanine amidase
MTTVIDPGHGGSAAVGGSSPNRATAPNGLLEKDLALDVARRLARLLLGTGEVILTRDADTNLSLADRAQQAKRRNADVFLSLHFNGSDNATNDATEGWIARNPDPRSRALAESAVREIVKETGTANWGVVERDLGLLLSSRHAAGTAACLMEIAHLTNARRAAALATGDSRQAIAEALNRAVRQYLSGRALARGTALEEPVVTPCEVPARPADAISGSDFVKTIMSSKAPAKWVDRENAIFDQIRRGNIPNFLRRWKSISVSFTEKNGTVHKGTYKVMPDYLAIGSDQDYVLMPMDAITAQRCADAFCCLLPTAKMVHDIYLQADVKLEAKPRDDYKYKDGRQQSTASYVAHDATIKAQLGGRAPGDLIAGHKKDVVISNLLDRPEFRNKLAFYGWFDAKGVAIQKGPTGGASVAHDPGYADYAHGVRLIHPLMTVDGKGMTVESVLKDSVLSKLLTEEGPMAHPRIMAKRAAAAQSLQTAAACTASDVAVTDTMALLVSGHAPLPVTTAETARLKKKPISGAVDDYKSICSIVPPNPQERLLMFFHGNNNYVTVAPSGDVPVKADPSGHSRVPRWATDSAHAGASGKPAAPIKYRLDSLDAGQSSLAPADAFDGLDSKRPVVLVPEDAEFKAGGTWAVPPPGQYGKANDGTLTGPGTKGLEELIIDCYDKLRCLKNPSGSYYLEPRMENPASWAGNLRRIYVSGHSGGGKPLVEAAGADCVLVTSSSTMGVGNRAAELWLFDCTYKFGIHNYVNFIKNWKSAGHLAYAADGARFICVYGPRTKESDTESEADSLRGEIAKVLGVKPGSLLKLHDSNDMKSASMIKTVIPALRSSPVLFIRTGVGHDNIPTKFIPLLLRTAAS